jgi:hypothetical protein
VISRIIYEWGTCTCAIRGFKLEDGNIEIQQHVLVVKYFGCNRCGIGHDFFIPFVIMGLTLNVF